MGQAVAVPIIASVLSAVVGSALAPKPEQPSFAPTPPPPPVPEPTAPEAVTKAEAEVPEEADKAVQEEAEALAAVRRRRQQAKAPKITAIATEDKSSSQSLLGE